MNTLTTAILLGGMTGLLLLVGQVVGGQFGMMMLLPSAIIINLYRWFYSETFVPEVTGARPVSYEEYPALHNMVAEVAVAAVIPKPPKAPPEGSWP